MSSTNVYGMYKYCLVPNLSIYIKLKLFRPKSRLKFRRPGEITPPPLRVRCSTASPSARFNKNLEVHAGDTFVTDEPAKPCGVVRVILQH